MGTHSGPRVRGAKPIDHIPVGLDGDVTEEDGAHYPRFPAHRRTLRDDGLSHHGLRLDSCVSTDERRADGGRWVDVSRCPDTPPEQGTA